MSSILLSLVSFKLQFLNRYLYASCFLPQITLLDKQMARKASSVSSYSQSSTFSHSSRPSSHSDLPQDIDRPVLERQWQNAPRGLTVGHRVVTSVVGLTLTGQFNQNFDVQRRGGTLHVSRRRASSLGVGLPRTTNNSSSRSRWSRASANRDPSRPDESNASSIVQGMSFCYTSPALPSF
jgi:hypothetical protein